MKGVKMRDHRKEILNRLNAEPEKGWVSLMIFALLGCADVEELKKLKKEILLLKNEKRISLYFATPEEVLDYVKNYYSNEGTSVDKEWQDKWLKWAHEQTQDLKNFFNNSARLIKE
jgi:hypothetical protein